VGRGRGEVRGGVEAVVGIKRHVGADSIGVLV